MKKILILGLLLTLTSCGFESKAEFEAKNTPQKSEEIDFPEIKYLPSTNSGSSNLDFEETYGKGKMGAVSYTHLTLPTIAAECRSRWSPYH